MISFQVQTGSAFDVLGVGGQTAFESAANMCAKSKVVNGSSQTPYRAGRLRHLAQDKTEERLTGSSPCNVTQPAADAWTKIGAGKGRGQVRSAAPIIRKPFASDA
jgi:hypothetical protein